MEKVHLVFPKTGLDKYSQLPLGLLSIASNIVEDYEVKIIDQRLDYPTLRSVFCCCNQNILTLFQKYFYYFLLFLYDCSSFPSLYFSSNISSISTFSHSLSPITTSNSCGVRTGAWNLSASSIVILGHAVFTYAFALKASN